MGLCLTIPCLSVTAIIVEFKRIEESNGQAIRQGHKCMLHSSSLICTPDRQLSHIES